MHWNQAPPGAKAGQCLLAVFLCIAPQTPWYEMALQHVKAAVLGTPPDTLSLGPPWTKWPGGSALGLKAAAALNAALRGIEHVRLSSGGQLQLMSQLTQAALTGQLVEAYLKSCAAQWILPRLAARPWPFNAAWQGSQHMWIAAEARGPKLGVGSG